MEIRDLNEEDEKLHFVYLGDWPEEMKDEELCDQNTIYCGMAFNVDTWSDETDFTFTQACDESVLDFEE